MSKDLETYLKPIFLIGKFTYIFPDGLKYKKISNLLWGLPYLAFYLYCLYENRTEMHVTYSSINKISNFAEKGINYCAFIAFFFLIFDGISKRNKVRLLMKNINDFQNRHCLYQKENFNSYIKCVLFFILLLILAVIERNLVQNLISNFKIFFYVSYATPMFTCLTLIFILNTVSGILLNMFMIINWNIKNGTKKENLKSIFLYTDLHFEVSKFALQLNSCFDVFLLLYFCLTFTLFSGYGYMAVRTVAQIIYNIPHTMAWFWMAVMIFSVHLIAIKTGLRSWLLVAEEVRLFNYYFICH